MIYFTNVECWFFFFSVANLLSVNFCVYVVWLSQKCCRHFGKESTKSFNEKTLPNRIESNQINLKGALFFQCNPLKFSHLFEFNFQFFHMDWKFKNCFCGFCYFVCVCVMMQLPRPAQRSILLIKLTLNTWIVRREKKIK